MTPEQHQIYHTTYNAALGMLLGRCSDANDAVRQASQFASLAVDLYPAAEPAPADPAKRRQPKESK